MKVAGRWGEPTFDGPRRVTIDGREFSIPANAELKLITGSRGLQFGHVRLRDPLSVVVLCRLGQLEEGDDDAAERASDRAWLTLNDDHRDDRNAASLSRAAARRGRPFH